MKKTDLNQFNTGGSHSSNPLGGIPIGQGQNGRTNTVQEGETSKGDFIFSNDIKLNKSTIKEFNLPPNLEGKTVAQATKIIDNKFKDRNDNISTSTKTKMLDGIAMAQESIKAQRESLSQSLEANSTEVPDMMNGDVPTGMEQFTQNQMFLGGDTEETSEDTVNPNTKSLFTPMNILGAAGGGFGLLNQAKGNTSTNTLTSAFTGATTGAAAGSLLGPLGSGIGAAIGTGVGIIGSNTAKKRAEAEAMKQHIINSGTYQNDFALGGNTRPKVNSVLDPEATNNLNLNNDLASQYYFNNLNIPTTSTLPTYPTSTFENNTPPKANLKPVANWLGNNYGDIMRYAPVAANALQLNNLQKPGAVRLNRLNNRFTPDYVDERSVQNIIGNETDNTINALTNATNGSIGSLRNSIMGASINRTKGLSDAYLNLSAQNRAQNLQGQQFNAGIDQANIGQANMEQDINDRNSAAYRSAKSSLIGQIGTDIGEIGKEQVLKKAAINMYGYRSDGTYFIKPDGTKITPAQFEEELKKDQQTNTAKLGGMLFKNKKK